MSKLYNAISGVILAGGRSNRMGFPKSNLLVKGKRIIDITLEVLQTFFDEIFIVTDDRKQIGQIKGANVVEDLVKGCGPMAGIYTGLKVISNDRAFFVACDMPFLHPGLISRLLDSAKDGSLDCVIPHSDKGIEPLHAVYAKSILAGLEDALSRGELSIRQLLHRYNCKYIKSRKEELSSFFNINTPEDLKEIYR